MEMTCLNCGWVHFGVTRQYAEDQVEKFNLFFERSTQETKDLYGNRKSSIKEYEKCHRCGGSFLNFREAKTGDCPYGCTLNPIIIKEEQDALSSVQQESIRPRSKS